MRFRLEVVNIEILQQVRVSVYVKGMVYEYVSERGIYYYKINEINVILMEGSQLVNLNDLFSRKV
jgi:hypothetical protein